MALNFGRLRPTRTTLTALVGLLWALSFGAVRDFVWADLREGLINLHGLSLVTRGLVWLGFLLLFAMVGALLFNDFWRELFPLLTSVQGVPGRGSLLPVALAPASLFLISIAWSFALAGALHSHWTLRLAAFFLYAVTAMQWIGASAGFTDPTQVWLLWALLGATLIVMAVRSRNPGRPAFNFAVLLVLIAATFAFSQRQGLLQWHTTGIPVFLANLNFNMGLLASLITPLLLLIGVDIANFTYTAAKWLSSIATSRLPIQIVYGLLALLLGWRLRDVLVEGFGYWRETSLAQLAPSLVGALGVPLLVAVAWWLVTHAGQAQEEAPLHADQVAERAERYAMPLILASLAMQNITYLLLGLVNAANLGLRSVWDGPLDWWDRLAAADGPLLAAASWPSAVLTTPWRWLLFVSAIGTAVWLSRRGQRALALYLAILGLLHIWWSLTERGGLFRALHWDQPWLVNSWWLIIFVVVALVWLVRRTLTPQRAERLLLLVLITALLRQTDFIENPFSPFLGFAGVGFIAFGIVWDSLTIGSWANEGTPRLPRISRIFLYVGYVLLTVTVLNWALTTHDLATVEDFTGGTALLGLAGFGQPMLYAIFAVTLALPPEASKTTDNENREEPLPIDRDMNIQS